MTSSPATTRQIEYDDGVVRAFLLASVIFGIVAFLVGVIIALQSSYTLDRWGANRFIANLVAVGGLRELAPLMTAILIAGRSGSAIPIRPG